MARSSSTRDFAYAAMADTRFDSAVVSPVWFCKTAVLVEMPAASFFCSASRVCRARATAALAASTAARFCTDRELRVTNFNADLVFQLLQTHLRLARFKLRAHLVRLRRAITQRNVDRNAHSLVGCSGIYQRVQSVAVSATWNASRRAATDWRIWTDVRGILRAAQSRSSVVSESIDSGQQRVANSLVADLAIIQIDAQFRKFRAVRQRIFQHVLHRRDRFLRRQVDGGGGNHLRLGEHRVFNRAAKRVLHQQLLQLQVGLRQNQSLLRRGNAVLRAHDLNRRQGSELHLLLIVGKRLLRERQRLLLHFRVFVGKRQIPIKFSI